MLAEGIQEIVELGQQSLRPHILTAPAEPSHIYYLVEGNRVQQKEAHPAPRSHTMADLDSLAQLCERHACEAMPVSVWYSKSGVVALLDEDESRRDRASLPLLISPQMLLLESWSKTLTWLDQTTLVRVLRTVFPAAFSTPGVVEVFRRLKFRVTSEGTKGVEHGRSSLGKSLEAELTGAASIPEELSFCVPAWAGNALRTMCVVRVYVEIDAAAERIALVPEAGAVTQAWEYAEEDLGRKLRQALDGVPHTVIYRGMP